MRALLIFRERLRAFYARYSQPVDYALRFLAAFAVLLLVLRMTGYREEIHGILLALAAGLFLALLPAGAAVLFSAGLILAEFSAVSVELTLASVMLFLAFAMIMFGFQVRHTILILVAPLFLYLRLPYALALAVGLLGTYVSIIPAGIGIFAYYLMLYARQNNSMFTIGENTDRLDILSQVFSGVLGNPSMLLALSACCLSIVVVLLIRDLSINYAPLIGIASGLIFQLLAVLIGSLMLKLTVMPVSTALSALVSLGAALILWFFLYSADYSRTEYLNYEDDDYYYYVKAVPKMKVSLTDVRVTKINRVHKDE
ncbi:ABC transporter permease [Clostridium vitabionis]|jgi:hypothetical protein|uniref:ABC transporter permease n=1 Tax=Clostridium vitabionis TaxID=2784388 RepID=UPI00188C31A3|nr:ABC transporter permease [Clostridium vitabionis]